VQQEYKWFDLPRLEQSETRIPTRSIENGIKVVNLAYGINLYKNVFTKNEGANIIDKLENTINDKNSFSWSSAQVNDKEDINDLRNCLDLKYRRDHLGKLLEFNQDLFDIHKKVEDSLDKCLRDYESMWHLQMNYKEAFNFVKYLPGKYFKIHGDHGPYYSCTISAVVYLNDNYTGGEIDFPRHNIKIKPDAGDIVLFPSNFVYEHASCEVFDGIKYSVVIMTDYNDLHHKNHA
jgi:predicted 2-oxoglutarate/Fe(II)-dependent dioxygenase YbiX